MNSSPQNAASPVEGQGRWTKEEHAIFMQGLEHRPKISWKDIAAMVGTRTPRQTRTHAQKYYQKLARFQKRQEKKRSQQMEQMSQRMGMDSSILMYRPSFYPQTPTTPNVGPPIHHHHQMHTPVHAAPLHVERLPEIDVECLDALGQLFEPTPIVPRRLDLNSSPSWQQALTKPDHQQSMSMTLSLPSLTAHQESRIPYETGTQELIV